MSIKLSDQVIVDYCNKNNIKHPFFQNLDYDDWEKIMIDFSNRIDKQTDEVKSEKAKTIKEIVWEAILATSDGREFYSDRIGFKNVVKAFEYLLNQKITLSDYQSSVEKWCLDCFGEEIATNTLERCFRFIEEALELVQSLGVTKEQVLSSVDYTFNRPSGETTQEVGGVMVTLAALCSAGKLNLENSAIQELERIILPENIEKIRRKHFNKPKEVLSPIPGNLNNESN